VIWFPRTDAFAAFPATSPSGHIALTRRFPQRCNCTLRLALQRVLTTPT
jgi:hypothetical protein